MIYALRFGVLVFLNTDWSEIRRCSKRVEDLGFYRITLLIGAIHRVFGMKAG